VGENDPPKAVFRRAILLSPVTLFLLTDENIAIESTFLLISIYFGEKLVVLLSLELYDVWGGGTLIFLGVVLFF